MKLASGTAKPAPRSLLRVGLLGLGLISLAAVLWAWSFTHSGLPRRRGAAAIPGLSAPVRVRFDDWGVPHLDGASFADLARGMGYVHANDRFLQLELGRRQAAGRLAEVLGERAVGADRYYRGLGLTRIARAQVEAAGAETSRLLDAYADGVNAWLAERRGDLPPDVRLLLRGREHSQPDPWKPIDSVYFQLLMAHDLGFWQGRPEETRFELLASLGRERFADLMGDNPHVPREIADLAAELSSQLATREADRLAGFRPDPVAAAFAARRTSSAVASEQRVAIGSNNWAVDGNHAASGLPLLASDPHLALRLPSIWYQALLRAPDYEAAGMTLIGFPFVVIGRGPDLAWGFTNTMLDDHDLFFEEVENGRVRRGDRWVELEQVEERILVRGADPIAITVSYGDRGVVLPPDEERGLPARSLSWTAAVPSDPSTALLNLARARSIDDVREIGEMGGGLEGYAAPAQNLVAADRAGGILQTVIGRVPLRRRGDGRLPSPGWDERYGWSGLRPQHANPTVERPGRGFLTSANNDVRGSPGNDTGTATTADEGVSVPRNASGGPTVSDDDDVELDAALDVALVGNFDTDHRVRRIEELLAARGDWTPTGFAELQSDTRSLYASEVIAATRAHFKVPNGGGDAQRNYAPEDPRTARALDLLAAWDGDMRTEAGPAAALFVPFDQELYRAVFADEVHEAARRSGFNRRRQLTRLLRGDMTDSWYDDVSTTQTEGARDIFERALAVAWQRASEAWGEDSERWNYETIHTLTLTHPLGSLPVVGSWLNRGPMPIPGSATSVAAFGGGLSDRRVVVTAGPSMRWIADLSEADSGLVSLPGGQSGHPLDPHYTDQLQPYLQNQGRPLRFTEAAIAANTVSTMALLPTVSRSLGAGGGESGDEIDLLLVSERVVDGSGAAAGPAAIGVRGDRIVYVGPVERAPRATETLDVGSSIIAPGFIDTHTHALSAANDPRRSLAENYLCQGVTTLVAGNDGGGPFTVQATFEAMERNGLGPNVGLLVGHDPIRRAVVGADDRHATDVEIARMRELVEDAMREGALGFSTGLFYPTGFYAETSEVIELARGAAAHGGIYDSHMRDEGSFSIGVLEAVRETVRIGEEAGLPVHIAHIKALGPDNWGLSEEIVAIIAAARARGLRVTADQYPYAASSTTIAGAVLPRWALAGGDEAFAERYGSGNSNDPETAASRMLTEIEANIALRAGPQALQFSSGPELLGRGGNSIAIAGRTLADVAAALGVSPAEASVRVQLGGGASVVSFDMSDADVKRFRGLRWVMTSSDGSLVLPGEGVPHPRSYGSFARVISHFVRDTEQLTLPEAIRSATSLPAATFGLGDRGLLRAGATADVIVFDAQAIDDRATFAAPHAHAAGVAQVIVNGRFVIRDGELTGARPGRGLRCGEHNPR